MVGDTETGGSLAAGNARRRKIALSVAKMAAKEWAINFAVATTVQEVAEIATASVDPNSDRSAKLREAILWLSRSLDTPVGP